MTARDGHVRVLPLHVANKIAAGEVVERPASVVKELVENSLDAGARTVRVAVVQGGRKLVSVQDDGCGMSRDDAVLSLERQATSKILDVGDIEELDTLGFRGEAIPSIASVSRFTLVTRPADAEEATQIVVNAGNLADVSACGAPPGTRVEVRDLFCNVPARKKFLRAYTTEEAHIKEVFAVHALAHPSLAMSLTVDGREVWRFAGGASLEDRIRELYGPDFTENLLSVSFEGNVSVHGYVEQPGRQNSFRREQHVFINGRPASSPVISYALKDAYPSRPGDARPTAIIFIDLPPEQVDVNVHPAKREVRFRRPADVRDAISQAIASAFSLPPPSPPPLPHPAPILNSPFPVPIQPTPPPREVTPLSHTDDDLTGGAAILAAEQAQLDASTRDNLTGGAAVSAADPTPLDQSSTMETATGPWRWFNFLAQTSTGLILLETDAGLVTIHPQAALERIAYERLLDTASAASQPLLIPETVKLTPLESVKIASFVDVLSAQGFQLEPFGDNVWKLDAVPQALGTSGAGEALAAIAHDIAENGARRGGERWREELVAKAASRAVAGKISRCTPEGAKQLVQQLASCRMPYVCPRGKPTMTFTSNRELSRKFDRG